MKKVSTTTPDLLTPVQSELKKLDRQQLMAAAKACDAGVQTVIYLRDGVSGPKGPSYNLVRRLHQHLVTGKQSAPA